MHEVALAEAVVATALEQARAAGRPLRRARVRIGELQQIDVEVFAACLEAARPAAEPLLAGARFDVEAEPATLRCRACGAAFGFDDLAEPPGPEAREAIHFVPELAHAWVRCPGCGSPDFEVTGGRGVTIEALEVEAP